MRHIRNSIPILWLFVLLAGVINIHTDAAMPPAPRRLLQQHSVPRETSAPDVAIRKPVRLGDHYLLLVNTAVASQMDAQKLEQFNRSPYDGLAVSFGNAFDTAPALSIAEMEAQIAIWRKSTTKDIWPWVYMNRMIGGGDAEASEYAKVPYFQRIQGVDLEDKAGAQKDFLENWRNGLQTARATRVPGIVFDPEFYNNYKAYDLGELARVTGKPPQDLVELLRQLGTRLADSAAVEYPGATLWFFFTGFTRPDYRVIDGQPYFLASTYIAEGLLDRIQRRHLPLRVVTGGEVGLGYCHASVEDLRQGIEKRADVFTPLLKEYGGALELAGTITLWSDRSAKRSWVAQGACGASSAANVEELEPYVEILFRTYRYNWIYGSPNGGYSAFQADRAPRFDAAITRAKALAFGAARP